MSYEANLFEFIDAGSRRYPVQRWSVRGLSTGADRPIEVERLCKAVSLSARSPVAHLDHDGELALLMPAGKDIPEPHLTVGPRVARLEPTGTPTELGLNDGEEGHRFWMAALGFAVRGRFLWSERWASDGRSVLLAREPVHVSESAAVHRGFRLRVTDVLDGRPAVCVDVVHRYLDTRPLPEAYPEPARAARTRALYHFGSRWYVVKVLEPVGESVAEHLIPCPKHGPEALIDYLRHATGGDRLIADLAPDSPAVYYEGTAGERRSAPAMLLYPTVRTSDPRVSRLHSAAILPPPKRRELVTGFVKDQLADLSFEGVSLPVSAQPSRPTVRSLPVKALCFGAGRKLEFIQGAHTGRGRGADYGAIREQMLDAQTAGPFANDALGTQHVLVPSTLSRGAAEGFRDAVAAQIARLLPGSEEVRLIRYPAPQSRRLPDQLEAITSAVQECALGGYGVLVFPRDAHAKLHDHLHLDLQDLFHFQGAMATQVERRWGARRSSGRGPEQYAFHIALGVLLKNYRAPFVLDGPLHHAVTIGLDVRRHVAGISFLARGGEVYRFRSFRDPGLGERLGRRRLAEELGAFMGSEVERLGLPPGRVLVLRDGRFLGDEDAGVTDAVASIAGAGRWQATLAEIHKTSGTPLRLWRNGSEGVTNPQFGAALVGEDQAIICPTGEPFRLRGTAKPLLVIKRGGELGMQAVAEDVFAWSLLAWTSPRASHSLPLPLRLTDAFLETRSPESIKDEDFGGGENSS